MNLGTQHCPLGLHALWGLRAAGLVGGRPRGGWPATVVRGVWCQALSLPRPPVLWSGQPGFRDPRVPGAVGAGVGTEHRPHGARLAGRRCSLLGWQKGVPGGGVFNHCEGRLGSGAVPPPTARPLGGLLGSATHVLWARVWVCAVCVVSVRCLSWCAVPLFSCPPRALLSGASVWCGACRVPCAGACGSCPGTGWVVPSPYLAGLAGGACGEGSSPYPAFPDLVVRCVVWLGFILMSPCPAG